MKYNMELSKLCRICFVDNAELNIAERQVWVAEGNDMTENYTILEILQEMYDQQLPLPLTQEVPMICQNCRDECLQHYAFYSKLKVANRQLQELYEQAQFKEIVVAEEDLVIVDAPPPLDKEEPTQKLNNQDSLIVSEFLPVSPDKMDVPYPNGQLRTVDYAAVELKHDHLDEYNEANRLLGELEPNGSQVIYKCKYCPLAYASAQFLKTHVRKTHVCQYCTTAFVRIKDLQAHIRSKHAQHQCVVCANSFSSSSNLRAHLRRVHGVQLPAQVALLDYRRASTQDVQN